MNNPNKRLSSTTRTLTQLALLTAVVLVMAYTPLGYIRVGLLTMSLLTVPVAIGAMLTGPAGGAWLGLVFGLTSFMNAVNGTGGLTAFAFQYNPVLCFITCVVARVACGLCCGLLYMGAVKLFKTHDKAACLVGALSAPLLNTLFFMGCLLGFFFQLEPIQNTLNSQPVQDLLAGSGIPAPLAVAVVMVGVQGLIEAVVSGVISTAVTVALRRVLKRA